MIFDDFKKCEKLMKMMFSDPKIDNLAIDT